MNAKTSTLAALEADLSPVAIRLLTICERKFVQYAASTIKNYTQSRGFLLDALDEAAINTLDELNHERTPYLLITKLGKMDMGQTVGTVQRRLQAITTMLRWLEMPKMSIDEFVGGYRAMERKMKLLPSRKVRLVPEDFAKVLQIMDDWVLNPSSAPKSRFGKVARQDAFIQVRAAFTLAACASLRMSELMSVQTAEISSKEVTYYVSKNRGTPKPVTKPMNPQVFAAAILPWVKRQNPGRLFTCESDRISHYVRKASEKAGIDCGNRPIHAWRTAVASWIADDHGDALDVQAILGHANLSTSQQYIAESAMISRSNRTTERWLDELEENLLPEWTYDGTQTITHREGKSHRLEMPKAWTFPGELWRMWQIGWPEDGGEYADAFVLTMHDMETMKPLQCYAMHFVDSEPELLFMCSYRDSNPNLGTSLASAARSMLAEGEYGQVDRILRLMEAL